MSNPLFYIEPHTEPTLEILLSEETSKHIAQVLRKQIGDSIDLTDGRGWLYTTTIIDNHKKKCRVKIEQKKFTEKPTHQLCMAVSLLKNASRFEWFLEKATEIGIIEIIPLRCSRTEKQHFRMDRMKGILMSAMLQSQQQWLPVLHEPTDFELVIRTREDTQKFIAHCEPDQKNELAATLKGNTTNGILLIGPEGDFTPAEISLAIANGYVPVALGNTRLRTETAALVGAVLMAQQFSQ